MGDLTAEERQRLVAFLAETVSATAIGTEEQPTADLMHTVARQLATQRLGPSDDDTTDPGRPGAAQSATQPNSPAGASAEATPPPAHDDPVAGGAGDLSAAEANVAPGGESPVEPDGGQNRVGQPVPSHPAPAAHAVAPAGADNPDPHSDPEAPLGTSVATGMTADAARSGPTPIDGASASVIDVSHSVPAEVDPRTPPPDHRLGNQAGESDSQPSESNGPDEASAEIPIESAQVQMDALIDELGLPTEQVGNVEQAVATVQQALDQDPELLEIIAGLSEHELEAALEAALAQGPP